MGGGRGAESALTESAQFKCLSILFMSIREGGIARQHLVDCSFAGTEHICGGEVLEEACHPPGMGYVERLIGQGHEYKVPK